MNKASAELILRGLENFANSMSKVADRKQKDKESQRQQGNIDRSFEYAKGRDSIADALAKEQIERAVAQNNRTTAANAGKAFASNPLEFTASGSLGAYDNLDQNRVDAAIIDAMNNDKNALKAQQASATQQAQAQQAQAQAQQAQATQKQKNEILKMGVDMMKTNPEMGVNFLKTQGIDLEKLGYTGQTARNDLEDLENINKSIIDSSNKITEIDDMWWNNATDSQNKANAIYNLSNKIKDSEHLENLVKAGVINADTAKQIATIRKFK